MAVTASSGQICPGCRYEQELEDDGGALRPRHRVFRAWLDDDKNGEQSVRYSRLEVCTPPRSWLAPSRLNCAHPFTAGCPRAWESLRAHESTPRARMRSKPCQFSLSSPAAQSIASAR